jgi:diguanylate cyclase (GGDEF)-like protein
VAIRPGVGRATSGARRGFVVAVTLVAVILAVQLASSIVSAVLASRDAQGATRQLFGVVGDVTIERVGRYSQAAEEAVSESVVSLERANPVTDVDAIASDLYGRIRANPQVGAIKVGWSNGDYVELRREGDGYALHVVTVQPKRVTVVRSYDASLVPVNEGPDPENATYDPRGRPWYIEGAAATGVAWTDPYLLFATQTPAVSAVRAARVGNQVVAVVAADLLLDQLSVVLDGLPVGSGGEAFIFDADRKVVAAPGTYTARIDGIGLNQGRVATAADLGVTELPQGDASKSGGAFGQDGGYVILEREFSGATGPNWLLHLRATRSGLSPALGAWEGTVLWTTFVSTVLVLIAVGLLLRVWRPLMGMRTRATTDALTGLPNRHELRSLGPRMVASAGADGAAICLALVDLDEFKEVNDTLGHKTGDDALVIAGQSLLSSTRARDFVARIGGDEFVVIRRADDESDREVAARIEELRAELAHRLTEAVPGVVGLGATVGYVVEREGVRSLEELLRDADSALVRGKATAKGAAYRAPQPGRLSAR